MELSMSNRKALTRVVAARYRAANRKGKGQILDEFVASTGYNRAYAAMLLRNYELRRTIGSGGGAVKVCSTKKRRKATGRPVSYGPEVQRALEKLWKNFGHLCGKRLVVVIRCSLPFVAQHPSLGITKSVCAQLASVSAATADRLLAAARKRLFLKGLPHTHPVSALATQIPVRTFSDWQEVDPGHLQLDLVGHDGGTASGEFCFTLCATDVCTGWSERRAMLAKATRWVCGSLAEIRSTVPFQIREIHPDNGTEFINHNLFEWCRQRHIAMTRSRANRKNDNCYVEQKNFDAVRKLVGYYRFAGPQAVQLMNELYLLHGMLQNYVYPSQKLLSKTRHGSAVSRRHDAPTTPASRLLACPQTTAKVRWKIHAVMQNIDPIAIAQQCQNLQLSLIRLAVASSDRTLTGEGSPA